MTAPTSYRWPTKLRRYGITDPFLKLLVAKYENEIPWQIEVRDEPTLLRFVEEQMLPRVLRRVALPITDESARYYVTRRSVDLQLALTTDPDLDDTDIGVLKLIAADDGPEAASDALVELVNARKRQAYQRWTDLVRRHYRSDAAFAVLILRPIFDLGRSGTRRSVIAPSPSTLIWLRDRIAKGRMLPSENLARIYCLRLSGTSLDQSPHGWHYVPGGAENAPRLAALCRGSGWCVADEAWATGYLRRSDFYILHSAGRPVVALRLDGASYVVECQGRGNTSPASWFPDIYLFVKTQDMRLADRADEMKASLKASAPLSAKPTAWWRDRIRHWPFAILEAPPDIRTDGLTNLSEELLRHTHFPAFASLAARAGIAFSEDDWQRYLEAHPECIGQCPDHIREEPRVREACLRGWLDRAEAGVLDPQDVAKAPDFLLADSRFREVGLNLWVGWARVALLDDKSVGLAPEFIQVAEQFRSCCVATWISDAGRHALTEDEVVTAPDFVLGDPKFQSACFQKWLALGSTDPLSAWQINNAPEFVKANRVFQTACAATWMKEVKAGRVSGLQMTQAPDFVKADPVFHEACVASCTANARGDRMSMSEMGLVPSFVSESLSYQDACVASFVRQADAGRLSLRGIANAPAFLLSDSSFQNACIETWTRKVQSGDSDLPSIDAAPQFVTASEAYQRAIRKRLPPDVRDRVRRNPCNPEPSDGRFDLETFLPANLSDPPELAVEHVVNALLTNESGVFSDDRLPEAVRHRADFPDIRWRGWREALQAHPPLWFALPADLAADPEFQPLDSAPGHSDRDLDQWVAELLAKPWLLTDAHTVPAQIRHHGRILDAYRRAWVTSLQESPGCLFVVQRRSRKSNQCAYMSYALLYDGQILGALEEGWSRANEAILPAWRGTSERVRRLAPIQVSILRATIGRGARLRMTEHLIASEIAHMRRRTRHVRVPDTPLDTEIRSFLAAAGF
jgi:hypothetical protein